MPSSHPALETLSDPALAELSRANDTSAFAELWRRHSNAGTAAARQFSSIADPQDIVSEAYVRILRILQQGGGPREAFRPYLYRTVRNIALDWRARRPTVSLEDAPDLVDAEANPEISVLENAVTAKAFEELPERWRAVLWYLEVENMSPTDVAPLLGLSPNATSALAGRAHEGFKRAWLQAHVNDRAVPPDCQWTTARMGQYVRHGLTKRSSIRFDRHVEDCARCTLLLDEIGDLGGRLASVLLPLVVGSTAGSALIGQFGRSTPTPGASSSAPSASISRRAVTATVAVIGLVLVATGAFALTNPGASTAPPAVVKDDNDPANPPSATPSQQPTPDVTATAQPTPTPPPQPPSVRGPIPLPVPRDQTPPGVPAFVGAVDGLLTNSATPSFSGTGEPGATVEAHVVDPVTNALTRVLSAVVRADGTWSASTTPLANGSHALRLSQTDTAGNRSASVTVTITVDTVALAPSVDALPPSPLVYLPNLSGTAEPGATVTIRDDTGLDVATALADALGHWAVPLPDPVRDGAAVTASQLDLAGNTSPWSATTAPMAFDRPRFATPAHEASIPTTAGSTTVQVELVGLEGLQVQVFVDGISTGNVHTLEPTPIVRVTQPLADGMHTIGVRYFDPATGSAGSMHTIAIQIG